MDIFKDTRKKIASYIIKSKLKKKERHIKVCNIKNANKVAIICNSADTDNLKACKNMESFLQKYNITFEILGFDASNQSENNLIGDSTHHYINTKDFNLFYQPILDETKKIINEPYDILFNLYEDNSPELESILSLSQAKFKLGPAHFNPKIHDLMLELDPNKRNPNYIVEQMQHYITIINA